MTALFFQGLQPLICEVVTKAAFGLITEAQQCLAPSQPLASRRPRALASRSRDGLVTPAAGSKSGYAKPLESKIFLSLVFQCRSVRSTPSSVHRPPPPCDQCYQSGLRCTYDEKPAKRGRPRKA